MAVVQGLNMQRRSIVSGILSWIKSLAEQFASLLRRLAAWFKGLDTATQVTLVGIVVTIAGAFVTVDGIISTRLATNSLSPPEPVSPPTHIEQSIHSSARDDSPLSSNPINGRFAVIQPGPGEVGSVVQVKCTSPWPDWNYYPVVTPVTNQPNPPKWIQASLTPSSPDIRVGEANIGRGALDRHKKFLVSCIATRTPLDEGLRDVLPGDARFSTPVRVELPQ